MGSIESTMEGLFFISEGEPDKCLIDYEDYYANLGAIPLHTINNSSNVILADAFKDVTTSLAQTQTKQEHSIDAVSSALITAFVFMQSLDGYRPLRILEIGCDRGDLTFILARGAHTLHPESSIWGLSEDLYDSNFIKNITSLNTDELNSLSLMTASPDSDIIRDCYFDIVVLNGTAIMGTAEYMKGILTNALRSTRPGGFVICFAQNNTELYEQFASNAGEHEKFIVSDSNTILMKRVLHSDFPLDSANMTAVLHQLMDLEESLLSKKEYEISILESAYLAFLEIEQYCITTSVIANLEAKILINEAKETVLNCIYAESPKLREDAMKKLLSIIHKITANLKS